GGGGAPRPHAPEPADQGKRHSDGGKSGDDCSPAHGGSSPLCGATGATSAQNAERLARAFSLIHAYHAYRDEAVTLRHGGGDAERAGPMRASPSLSRAGSAARRR